MICIDDDDEEEEEINDSFEEANTSHLYTAKLLQFSENTRPAYYGTWRKTTNKINGRKIHGLDTVRLHTLVFLLVLVCLNFKLYGPFLWMGFNCLKAAATSRRQFTFYHSVPRNSWYSFYRPRKDERLSQPWSHPVVLNTGLLDWESSALTTRPLLLR